MAKCGAQALQLSDEELAANGEFTHEIDAALNITDAGARLLSAQYRRILREPSVCTESALRTTCTLVASRGPPVQQHIAASSYRPLCHDALPEHAEVQEDALLKLGFSSAADATPEFRKLGRRGRIPWCDPRYAIALAYISAGALVLVPIAHCLLRGLVRSLFIYALTTPVSSVSTTDPLVFNTVSRDKVKVLHSAALCHAYITISTCVGHKSAAAVA